MDKGYRSDEIIGQFKRLKFNAFMRQRPKGVTHILSICLVQRGLRVTPLGFYQQSYCERKKHKY